MIGKIMGAITGLFSDEESGSANNPHPNPFTNKVVAYCNELQWKYEVMSEGSIRMLFEEDDGRSQLVYFFRGETKKGLQVVSISSPAIKMSSVDASGMSKQDLFNEMLTDNGTSANYAWAISSFGDDDEVINATVDLLLDTMDLKEMEAAVCITSSVADKMEARFGVDDF